MKIVDKPNRLYTASMMRSGKRLVMHSAHVHTENCNHPPGGCNDPTHNHNKNGHNQEHPPTTQPPNKKNDYTLPIIGGIIALAAAAYLLYYYFTNQSGSTPEASPTTPKTT